MVCQYVIQLSGIFILMVVYSLHASPLIEVDKATYDCGTFVEGKNIKATASYEVKNYGDSLLKIESVRPGCGCVVAAYDTLIPPGKSGRIRLEARLDGYIGALNKAATITSNAKNNPSLRILLTATIQPVITVSERYITLPASNDRKPVKLYLTTKKKDLTVTSIDFKSYDNSNSGWQNQLTLPITYEWNRTDSISPDGYTVFMLSLGGLDLKKSNAGEIIISTNHPDKNEIRLSGRIE